VGKTVRERLVSAALTVALLLTACTGGGEGKTVSRPSSPTGAGGGERMIILFAVDDAERSFYKDLITAFEEANPNLQVRLVSIQEATGGSWDDDAWLRLASAADVINMDAYPQVVQQGLVRDLSPLIEVDPTFQPEDYYPGALESYQWDNGTWALPTRIAFDLLFFDKDAFDEVGEPYPEPDWTWDELLDKARALTTYEGDQVTRWGFVPPWPDHVSFIERLVGPLFDKSTDPPLPRFDHRRVSEATRWYVDLFLKGKVMPGFEPGKPDSQILTERRRLIEQGQAAMWPDTYAHWQLYREQRHQRKLGHLGVVPLPAFVPDSQIASRTTPLWTTGFFMSAGTRHPDAAWRWMSFLSRQPGLFTGWLPPRRSVAEASGFWKQVDEELASALHQAVARSYVSDRGTHGLVAYKTLSIAVEAILSGDKTIEDALIEAQVQAQADIQEERSLRDERTPAPTLIVVVPPMEQEPNDEGAVTIIFDLGTGSYNLQPLRKLARQFHEAHPDVTVEVSANTGFSLQSLAATADCFQWYPDFQNPANLAAILNLGPFIDTDPTFTTNDLYSPFLEQFTWQGQLWGLPAEAWPHVIEYNKALFDAAGVDYPALDWTTDDLLELAVALTQDRGAGKQYGFVAESDETADLVLMTERLGARLFDRTVDPPATSFDDPNTVEAVRWYAELSTVHGVTSNSGTETPAGSTAVMEREALISNGLAAMWTTHGPVPAFAFRNQLETGVAPLPVGPGGTGGAPLTASGYFLSARSQASPDVRQACWEWITFLSGQPEAVQGLPVRRSVAESEAYRQWVGAERAAAYLASVAGPEQASASQLFAEEAWLREAMHWLYRAYDQVLGGEVSVEAALATAQKLADDYRACVVARDAFSNREGWQACLRETDPDLSDSLSGREDRVD
jgi:ABC-type glycerol-3-phosphate transport system substrate-binding protein